MSADALSQYVALVYRLDSIGPRPREIDSHLQAATQLDVEDAWTSLRQLQRWLAAFPAEDSAGFVTKLVELAANYRVPNPPTLREIYKAIGPDADGRGRGVFEECKRRLLFHSAPQAS